VHGEFSQSEPVKEFIQVQEQIPDVKVGMPWFLQGILSASVRHVSLTHFSLRKPCLQTHSHFESTIASFSPFLHYYSPCEQSITIVALGVSHREPV